jgi:hypothetical protein
MDKCFRVSVYLQKYRECASDGALSVKEGQSIDNPRCGRLVAFYGLSGALEMFQGWVSIDSCVTTL